MGVYVSSQRRGFEARSLINRTVGYVGNPSSIKRPSEKPRPDPHLDAREESRVKEEVPAVKRVFMPEGWWAERSSSDENPDQSGWARECM